MTLPASGPVALSQYNTEYGLASNANVNLNDPRMRSLSNAGATGLVAMGNSRSRFPLTHAGSGGTVLIIYDPCSSSIIGFTSYQTTATPLGGGDGRYLSSWGWATTANAGVGKSGDVFTFTAQAAGPSSAQYRIYVSDAAYTTFKDITITKGSDQGFCPPCCFPAGNTVLMADMSYKEIQDLKPGDMIQGPTGPWKLGYLHKTKLGHRKMYGTKDGKCSWSSEHLFWTRNRSDNSEWWWSADPVEWRSEVISGYVVGLKDNFTVRTGEGWDVAHEEGWKSLDFKELPEYTSDTPIYLPVPAEKQYSDRMCFVGGYLATASTDQFSYDYSKFKWDYRLLAKLVIKKIANKKEAYVCSV